jgi:Tfp pilus assembly protein PilF
VHNNFGIVLDEHGQHEIARAHLERALSIDPAYALAHNNLGIVLVKLDRLSEAKTHFEAALRYQPGYAGAQENLKKTEEALEAK